MTDQPLRGAPALVRHGVSLVTFLVHEYDEAIEYFTQALSFELLEDTRLTPEKRWVRIAPRGGGGTALLLARADTPEQRACIGRHGGGRVAFFLHTDDFWRDYRAFGERGVAFEEQPREEEYGTVVVFLDLYGNRWDLVQLH